MTTDPRNEPRTDRASGRSISALLILGALVALGPLSTDAYVPGLPRLALDLHTTASLAQLTVTTCLVGLAAGQLLAGPMSDALGRRTPLLIGLVVYTAASVLCALAPNIAILIVLRGLQGVGGAFALVVAYAGVRDRYSGNAAARYFSLLLLVSGLAPVLAPIAGAQILSLSSWRGIFVALAGLSGAVLVASALALPESLPAHLRQPGGVSSIGQVYLQLLKDTRLVGYILANALVFAAMFAYISGSSFILEGIHGLSPQQYSFVFAGNAIGLVAASQANARLVRRIDPKSLLTIGASGAAAGGMGLLAIVTVDAGLWPTLAAFFVVVTSVGLVLPNAAALALENHGSHAGAASALLGFGQFLLGGLAAPLVGLSGADSALPTAAVIAGLGLAAVTTLVILARPSPLGDTVQLTAPRWVVRARK